MWKHIFIDQHMVIDGKVFFAFTYKWFLFWFDAIYYATIFPAADYLSFIQFYSLFVVKGAASNYVDADKKSSELGREGGGM